MLVKIPTFVAPDTVKPVFIAQFDPSLSAVSKCFLLGLLTLLFLPCFLFGTLLAFPTYSHSQCKGC